VELCGSGSDPHFLLAAVALDSSALAYAVEDGSSCLAADAAAGGDDSMMIRSLQSPYINHIDNHIINHMTIY